jgi:hypothetical protein
LVVPNGDSVEVSHPLVRPGGLPRRQPWLLAGPTLGVVAVLLVGGLLGRSHRHVLKFKKTIAK